MLHLLQVYKQRIKTFIAMNPGHFGEHWQKAEEDGQILYTAKI